MNTHKAHFQFLPVTSSGCEVKVSISAKAAAECPWKTEMAATLNKTVDFYNLKYRLYAWMQCSCTVVCMCFENKPLKWRVRIYISLYMQHVIQSLAHEHSRHGATRTYLLSLSAAVSHCIRIYVSQRHPSKCLCFNFNMLSTHIILEKNILESLQQNQKMELNPRTP